MLRQFKSCFKTRVDQLKRGIRQAPQLPQDLVLVERKQIDTVHHGILSQPRLPAYGRGKLNQQLRWFQNTPRYARDLDDNGVQQSLVVAVVLNHKRGRTLAPLPEA